MPSITTLRSSQLKDTFGAGLTNYADGAMSFVYYNITYNNESTPVYWEPVFGMGLTFPVGPTGFVRLTQYDLPNYNIEALHVSLQSTAATATLNISRDQGVFGGMGGTATTSLMAVNVGINKGFVVGDGQSMSVNRLFNISLPALTVTEMAGGFTAPPAPYYLNLSPSNPVSGNVIIGIKYKSKSRYTADVPAYFDTSYDGANFVLQFNEDVTWVSGKYPVLYDFLGSQFVTQISGSPTMVKGALFHTATFTALNTVTADPGNLVVGFVFNLPAGAFRSDRTGAFTPKYVSQGFSDTRN